MVWKSYAYDKSLLFSLKTISVSLFNFLIILFLGIGEILLLVSLACDGLTGAVQERMKAEHATKSGHMMLSMNKWSIIYLGVALTATGRFKSTGCSMFTNS